MTSTRSAADTCLPKSDDVPEDVHAHGDFPKRQAALFQVRYARWLSARGAYEQFQLRLNDEYQDEEANRLSDEVGDCARLVMATFAGEPAIIWQKLEVLEHVLHGTGDCEWIDNRQVWMLASIKADLMAHGFGEFHR